VVPSKQLAFSVLGSLALVAGCDAQSEVGTEDSNWEAESVMDERGSTHLFIVESGLRILEREALTASAKALVAHMKETECAFQWRLGLHEADYRAIYNGGKADITAESGTLDIIREQPTWESHFYNPETGLNYRGNRHTALAETMKELASIKKLSGPRAERFDAAIR
jgi:hypothetical protein